MSSIAKFWLVRVIIAGIIIVQAPALAIGRTLQEQFDQLCRHTQNADGLSTEKLQELLRESDELRKNIESSDDQKKKLLLFRLNKCRKFIAYIIDIRGINGLPSQ